MKNGGNTLLMIHGSKSNHERAFSFTATPVPADETLTIAIQSEIPTNTFSVSLYTSDGKVVFSKNDVQQYIKISTKSFVSGNYLLEVADNLRKKKEAKSISIIHK